MKIKSRVITAAIMISSFACMMCLSGCKKDNGEFENEYGEGVAIWEDEDGEQAVTSPDGNGTENIEDGQNNAADVNGGQSGESAGDQKGQNTTDGSNQNNGTANNGNQGNSNAGNNGNQTSGNTGTNNDGSQNNGNAGNNGSQNSGNGGNQNNGNTGNSQSQNNANTGNNGNQNSGNTGSQTNGNTGNDGTQNGGNTGNSGNTGTGSTSKNPADMTFAEYLKLSRKEQQAFYESFADPQDFINWYREAEAAYEEDKDIIDTSGGAIDLEEILGGKK